MCFVGITGYRVAVDKRAQLGWQADAFGGTPVYVMPNTSGLNAHAKPADFVEHFRVVQHADPRELALLQLARLLLERARARRGTTR